MTAPELLKDLEAVALLADRLDQLSIAAAEQCWNEFSMRVPAEPSRDVDIVLASVARFLRTHHAEIAEAVSLSRKAERMEDALHQIKTWSEAYPLSVFPEPDWKRAAEVLEAAGMTLDRISAANMRHVIERVQQIADAAIDAQHNSAREGWE